MNAAYRLPAAAFMHVMCHRLVIKMIKLPLYHTQTRSWGLQHGHVCREEMSV